MNLADIEILLEKVDPLIKEALLEYIDQLWKEIARLGELEHKCTCKPWTKS